MGNTEESERILAEFFKNSGVGLAIFDQRFRYRMVNPYLAASNCAAIESHLGKHVEEILGEVGIQVMPAIETVFRTAKPVLNCEFSGALPTKPDGGRWLDSFFPISDSNGSVKQVGVVVVDLQTPIHLNSHRHGDNDILRSWKDIARYVGTCAKTAQRWEQKECLPVHRVTEKKGAVVFALPDEVDAWLRTRSIRSKSR
jgi:hypothetical protein